MAVSKYSSRLNRTALGGPTDARRLHPVSRPCGAALTLGMVASLSISASASEERVWATVSRDGTRQIRLDTLHTSPPLVTYLYRIVQPGEQRPDGLSEGTGVFVDCDNRGRREGVDMRKPYAPVASFGASAVEELEFACRWASEQPKYKEYANSYWGRAQSKPQSPTVVPPASQAPQARPPEATRPKPPATHVASAGSGFIVGMYPLTTSRT